MAATPAWTAEGDQAGAQLGSTASAAGDVNADRYGDVIVGANLYDGGEVDEGRAYVYHGGPTGLANTVAWTVDGSQAGAELGYSVGGAGDVNGDGYDDIIVGACRYDAGQTDEGRAYVYHGSATGPAGTGTWTEEVNQAGGYFGRWVSGAGDVNGDGYADVVITAYFYDAGQMDEGRACVYHGSASGLATAHAWSAESNQAGARYGRSASGVGDVNGDGYSDVIVGAHYYSAGQAQEG